MSIFTFFFNDTATTENYTLSLHDALPILRPAGGRGLPGRVGAHGGPQRPAVGQGRLRRGRAGQVRDRKSTRLNSSHGYISYAVFCLKKKKKLDCKEQHAISRSLQTYG